MKDPRAEALKGYKETYKTNDNKKYTRSKSLKYRERTGFYKTKINGGGHTAGFNWAQEKGIDPHERIRKYSKNSPSFDEGVHEYKQRAKERALQEKMK